MADLYWADPELAAEWLTADTIDVFGIDAHIPEWMVPVERCVHGRIDPHRTAPRGYQYGNEPSHCPGSPTFAEADDG